MIQLVTFSSIELRWENTYLLGIFFIISVVRLSSPLIMRSTSSSYCFLLSSWLELPSFLRLLARSLEGSNEFIIGIIWPRPGNNIHLWWWDWSPTLFEAIGKSMQFPPTWGKMLWETNSKEWGEFEILIFPREPGWNPEASGDSPAKLCRLSQREGFATGADPTGWLLMGIPGFNTWDGALGTPWSRGWGWAAHIPLTNDGEFGHIMPGGWGWYELLLQVKWCPGSELPLPADPKTEKENKKREGSHFHRL